MKRAALRTAIVVLAGLCPLLSAAAQESVPVVTLEQSIDAAISKGDDIKILQRSLDVSRAQHALNVSRNSLSLAGSAGYGATTSFGNQAFIANKVVTSPLSVPTGPAAGVAVTGPLTSVSVNTIPYAPPAAGSDATSAVGVSVTQTLWNGYPGGPSQATVDKSLLTLQGRELATESGTLGVIYGVKQAYYAMLEAQRSLALKKQIFEKQNSVLKQITAIYDLKLASTADLKTAQLNARSAQVDVNGAANDLRAARLALATFMAYPVDSVFTVADVPQPSTPVNTMEEAVTAGLARRVEIKQVELNIKSSNVDLALARGQAWPTVSVSGGVNWLYDWTGSTSAGVLGASVKLAMPVLDAGAVRNQVDSILRQNDVYALQETQLQKSISTVIQNAWQAVQLSGERLEVAKLGVEATDLQYQIVSAQRDSGTASNQDLLTAAVNLANAQNALATAQRAAELAVLQLQNVMGY
jgi:outer membrane protein TolC